VKKPPFEGGFFILHTLASVSEIRYNEVAGGGTIMDEESVQFDSVEAACAAFALGAVKCLCLGCGKEHWSDDIPVKLIPVRDQICLDYFNCKIWDRISELSPVIFRTGITQKPIGAVSTYRLPANSGISVGIDRTQLGWASSDVVYTQLMTLSHSFIAKPYWLALNSIDTCIQYVLSTINNECMDFFRFPRSYPSLMFREELVLKDIKQKL
jgi:hypothetical protein